LSGTIVPVLAQDLPTDAQLQAAFGTLYNRLGLMEYCADKGFSTPVDVANTRRMVDVTVAGLKVEDTTRAQQDIGRRGDIVGPQSIGLLDMSNPARPEVLLEGQTMSLAGNARAQQSSERALCRQMAAQVEPLP
jgi:hypothetical protein